MDRRSSVASLVRLTDDTSDLPLHERLYQRVRTLVLSGTLAHGTRLPSSRVLAASLGISRNSVLTALDRLIADCWLEARKGSGVYVRYGGRHVPAATFSSTNQISAQLPFAHGSAAVDLFPAALWNRLQSRRWKRMPAAALEEGDTLGWPALRRAISAHVAVSRGLECSPDQVMVTTSVSAALDLAVRALGIPGTEVWVEDPGYDGFGRCLQNCGMQPVPVPVDAAGLDVAYGELTAPEAKAALVTPACHFPTAVTMAEERRSALLKWAEARNAWILEDDHDWQSVPRNRSPRPLTAAAGARAIYLDSFNSMLFPALRIGYLICPQPLVDRFTAVRKAIDGHSSVPNQMILADFINGGHLDDHLSRLRAAYEERRQALVQALDRMLCGHLAVAKCDAGTRVIASLNGHDENVFESRSAANGINVCAMSRYRLLTSSSDQAIFGFAAFSTSAITGAVATLRTLLESDRPTPRRERLFVPSTTS